MTRSIEKFGCTLTVATLLAVGLGFSGAAQAGDAAEQAQTAADHAGYAAGSDGIDSVHAHLHHALNCLVGPNGEGFDASFGYPCDGMGSGALNDADMDHQTTYLDAIAEIKGGLATDMSPRLRRLRWKPGTRFRAMRCKAASLRARSCSYASAFSLFIVTRYA